LKDRRLNLFCGARNRATPAVEPHASRGAGSRRTLRGGDEFDRGVAE